MAKLDIESIKARAKAAYKGPWRVAAEPKEGGVPRNEVEPTDIAKELSGMVGWRGPEDAEFIAHSRTDVPDLVQEVEDLRNELEQVKADRAYWARLSAERGVTRMSPRQTPPWLGCTLPPSGWWCSAPKGHDGPCPTRPGSGRDHAPGAQK